MLDVLIQTHNEELNLPHTLQSIQGWVNRIFVVDSGSTDSTREIAAKFGANRRPQSLAGLCEAEKLGAGSSAVRIPVDSDSRCR